MDFPIDQIVAWLGGNMIALITAVVLLVTAYMGLRTYTSSVKLQSAKWLYKLYNQFYVESDLKEIRQIMDDSPKDDSTKELSFIEKLITKDEKSLNEIECDQLNQFTDYCNFFEFMMIIEKSKVLKLKDIEDMFDYYLDLFRSDIIEKYLELNHFQHLIKYLKENPPKTKSKY